MNRIHGIIKEQKHETNDKKESNLNVVCFAKKINNHANSDCGECAMHVYMWEMKYYFTKTVKQKKTIWVESRVLMANVFK